MVFGTLELRLNIAQTQVKSTFTAILIKRALHRIYINRQRYSCVVKFRKELWCKMQIENVAIDRVNLRLEKVTMKQFEQLDMRLQHLRYGSKLMLLDKRLDKEQGLFHIRTQEKLGGADYRYNIYVSEHETTDGAIFIGYKHNSAKASEYYDMKIEFNPNKVNNVQRYLLKALESIAKTNVVKLVECDVAIDIPYKTSDVYIVNKTGKIPSSCDTTRYFGQKHTNGYLKVYDKAKEQGFDGTLTRIEFTLKPNASDGMIYRKLLEYRVRLNGSYEIGLLNEIEDFSLKCVAIAITNGHIKRSEVPRYDRNKLDLTLSKTTNKVNVDTIINSRWSDLMESISEWFMWSACYSSNYALFGTEEREVTDDEQALFDEFMNFNDKKEYKKNLTSVGKLERKIER